MENKIDHITYTVIRQISSYPFQFKEKILIIQIKNGGNTNIIN